MQARASARASHVPATRAPSVRGRLPRRRARGRRAPARAHRRAGHGASYRRLDVPRLAGFEGAGVYYAATQVEAQMCGGRPWSSSVAATPPARPPCSSSATRPRVLLMRGGDLGAGMSRYLVDQVDATPAIDVHLHAQVRELHGDGELEAITRRATTGATRHEDARALFVFIGADPCTGWLDDAAGPRRRRFHRDRRGPAATHLDRGRRSPTRAVPAGDQPPGSLRRRRRALRLDQARRVGGRRGRDGRAAAASLPRTPRRAVGQSACRGCIDPAAGGRADPLTEEAVSHSGGRDR